MAERRNRRIRGRELEKNGEVFQECLSCSPISSCSAMQAVHDAQRLGGGASFAGKLRQGKRKQLHNATVDTTLARTEGTCTVR
ncbi:type II toxin-antitoxin system prevent-host-death family antitoxin [Sesbania bispinosa]|nr:type II toxin-antitoxin system prevent-host-death family antitoxin [Sesbania bispinosa]